MRWPTWLVAALVGAACGDSEPAGPFDSLPLDVEITEALGRPAYVARDRHGIAHIRARSIDDLAFVQGYVMAHDRLPQMDLLRRFGAGTLAELFGALDPSVIATDLEMRMHRMTPLAEATLALLKASQDPIDQQIVAMLERFADGVNRYHADLVEGKWDLDPAVAAAFDPARFRPWTAIDSLVLGRFQAFALSWTAPAELALSELYDRLVATFDAALPGDAAAYARRGISADLLTLTPVGRESTIDGFPNVDTDTGTRADDATARTAASRRPRVPQALYDQARRTLRCGIATGPFGALGPHAFMPPYAGSNSWAIGPGRTGGGAMLASDQHLQLANPTTFYPMHLTIARDDDEATVPALDVIGVTFPGIPGIVLGSNGSLAWAATVSNHDVNDIYLETIAPCGSGACVELDGAQVPIEPWTETIQIGALGTITRTLTVTYEDVPHHGPIIPIIEANDIVPRTASSALSVKFTGYEPTRELRALFNLTRAQSVDAGFEALADIGYGSQNWTLIDADNHIGWTTNAVIPLRAPAAYGWSRATPTAAAPFFVLDGTGGYEWEGRMDARYIPHAYDPPQGFLATANADPVGATFDNDPLNQPLVEGRPLYAGVAYAAGLREARIAEMIRAADGGALSLEALAAQQHDTKSTVGAALTPALLAALAGGPAPADVQPYLDALTADERRRLTTARALLVDWDAAGFATPAAEAAPDRASAATALFNTWMHFILVETLGDEFAAAGASLFAQDDHQLLRVLHAMLTAGDTLVPSATTGQPILCDRFAVAGADDSCTKLILQALGLAMAHLESPDGFGTADLDAWRWGRLHRLTIEPLVPNAALALPAPDGIAKAGDNFVVNRADQGWSDLDFRQSADGPAQRMLAQVTADGRIGVQWQLPGGTIFDSRSPHYRDLLDEHYLPEQHFAAPFTLPEILAAGETRWVFR